jgi:hypothetical protein
MNWNPIFVVGDRGHHVVVGVFLAATLAGCVDEHPAYDIEFLAGDAVVAQTSEESAGAAAARVSVHVLPTEEYDGNGWVTLGASERFPDGLLRLYEPADNPRFRYHERLPVLAVPARLVGDRVKLDETTLALEGQVSNLELAPLCGEKVVFVPRLVVWDSRPGAPGERDFDFDAARNVRVPVEATVECL